MLNSSMNPELQALLDRISALEKRDYIINEGPNFIQYQKGRLIYFFAKRLTGSAGKKQISYPAGPKFIDNPDFISTNVIYSTNEQLSLVYLESWDNTKITVEKYSSATTTITIIVIGRWK